MTMGLSENQHSSSLQATDEIFWSNSIVSKITRTTKGETHNVNGDSQLITDLTNKLIVRDKEKHVSKQNYL